MFEDWDRALADPYILDIASQFLEGYEREMNQQKRLIQVMEDPFVRRLLEIGSPALAAFYEGKTRGELEEKKSLMAIAAGVAFAIRRAQQLHQQQGHQ